MAANEWHVGPRTVTTASTFRFPPRTPTNSSPARRKPLDRVLTTLFGTEVFWCRSCRGRFRLRVVDEEVEEDAGIDEGKLRPAGSLRAVIAERGSAHG